MAMEWWMIAATVVGPILAVQAQKWVERSRAGRERRDWVFQTLMATRAARLSPDHVRALNMIDLTFYGAGPKRAKGDQEVLDAWKVYIDALIEGPGSLTISAWNSASNEMFIDMMEKMATALGYHFDRVLLKRHGYTPMAHGDMEQDQQEVRKNLIKVLAGGSALKMEITNIPSQVSPVPAGEHLPS